MINNYLRSHLKKITSQNGEEGVVQHLLEKIYGKKLSEITGLELCDIGSGDGFFLSQVYYFVKKFKFKSLLIDGDEGHIKQSKNFFLNNHFVHHENLFIDKINTIEYFLDKYKLKKDFDLLSIDVDGQDYHLFKRIKKYKPKIVIIETNMTMNKDSIIIEKEQKNSDHYVGIGSSPRAIYELAKEKGYKLCLQAFNNLILIDEKYFDLLDFEKNYNDEDELHSAFNLETFQDHQGNVHIFSTGPWSVKRIINHQDFSYTDTTGGVTQVDRMLDCQKKDNEFNSKPLKDFTLQKKYQKDHMNELVNFRNYTRDAQNGLNSQEHEPSFVLMDQVKLKEFYEKNLIKKNNKEQFRYGENNYIFEKNANLDLSNKSILFYKHIEKTHIRIKKQQISYKYFCHNRVDYSCMVKIDLNMEEISKIDPIKFAFWDPLNTFEIISANVSQIKEGDSSLYLFIVDDNNVGNLAINYISNFCRKDLYDNFVKNVSLIYLRKLPH